MDWSSVKYSIGTVIAIIGVLIGSVLGGWDTWLKVLALFVVLDYVSGLLAAFVERKLNSGVGFRGVAKKVLIFFLVAVAFSLDQLLGTEFIRIAVIGFYIGIEGLSILENASRAGLPLPKVLESALEELKDSGKGEANVKN